MKRKNGVCLEEYKRVEAYRASHPGVSIRAALRAVKLTESAYYRGAKWAARDAAAPPKARRARSVEQTTHVVADAGSGKLMVLIGTVEQIRGVIQ